VAIEPDWGTFVIDSDQRLLTRQFLNLWCDNFPAGWIGRRLFRYFRQLGLTEIEVEPITIEFTEFDLADNVLGLSQTVHIAKKSGMADQEILENWLNELKQSGRN
jgi:hypothetical protein